QALVVLMSRHPEPFQRNVQTLVIKVLDVLGVVFLGLSIRFGNPNQLQESHAVGIQITPVLLAHLPILVADRTRYALVSEIAQEAVAVVVRRGIVERAGAA